MRSHFWLIGITQALAIRRVTARLDENGQHLQSLAPAHSRTEALAGICLCTGQHDHSLPVIPSEVSVAAAVRGYAASRVATPRRRAGRSLSAAQAHARQEARRSSPERTAPAIAGSRNVRTGKARQPGLPCTPRGPRARTDHTSHSSPASFRSATGPRYPLSVRSGHLPARYTPALTRGPASTAIGRPALSPG
jgi:hypothetical protein